MSQTVLASPPAWQRDKDWAGRFLPEIKRICGEYLIGEAPHDEDAERNTDLVVLKLNPVRIACRVRKYEYLARYGDEFTIRTARPAGTKTEMAKVVEGWGDYIFYGFSDADGCELAAWVLGDLRVFRLWFMSQCVKSRQMPGTEKPNGDGSSLFRAFRIADLPASFVVARKFATKSGA